MLLFCMFTFYVSVNGSHVLDVITLFVYYRTTTMQLLALMMLFFAPAR